MPLPPGPVQLDFSAGMWRSTARHLIDERGAYTLRNFLLDEDGSAYARAGVEYLSTAGLGATGLRFIWDGSFAAGQRTVVANTDDFGVLDGSEGMVNLGGAGLTSPTRAVKLGDMLFIGGGGIYAGSRKTAAVSSGTATATNGSTTVTCSAANWTSAAVDAGMIWRSGSERGYVVASRDSDTQVTLAEPYEGSTGGGKAYVLSTVLAAATPYQSAEIYAVAGNRLFAFSGRRMRWSASPTDAGIYRPHSFAADDFHDFPDTVLGAYTVRDVLLVFCADGMWAVVGTALEPTDNLGGTQWQIQHVSGNIVLWSKEGLTPFSNGVIAPCVDGVYLIDGISAPVRLSASIDDLWRSHVQAGYKTGLAVTHNSHYFVPILDSSNVVQDLLVCRLDRPWEARIGLTFPWTQFGDFGGNVIGYAVRVGTTTRQPLLLAASKATGSRVLKCRYFQPQAGLKQDADETNFTKRMVTRNYATSPNGLLNKNQVRRLRVRYELTDAASDDPTIQAYYSVGVQQLGGAVWGSSEWGLADWTDSTTTEDVLMAGNADEDDGRDPYVWSLSKKARYIRFRLESSSPAANLILRSLELFIRPSRRS